MTKIKKNGIMFLKIYTQCSIYFWKRLIASRNAFKRRILNFQFQQFMLIARLLENMGSKKSRLSPRKGKWWKDIVARDYPDDEMIQHFRMRKDTFLYIVKKLEEDLKPSDNAIRSCVDVPQIVGIAIYKFASSVSYREVAQAFGVHKSTVKKCIYRFCKSINKRMLHEQISLPGNINELGETIDGFKLKCHMSPIIGAIGSTHIPISVPIERHANYVNRKGWESLILQVVADSSLLFRSIAIQHPGSCNDVTVFKNSRIYSTFYNELPRYEEYMDKKPIRPFLIGGPSYPLLPFLIKEFIETKRPDQESFNSYLNMGLVVVKQAIRRLKARWGILCKRIEIHYEFVPEVVSACCILHNIVEKNNDTFLESWFEELEASEAELLQPATITTRSYEITALMIRKLLQRNLEVDYPPKGNFPKNYDANFKESES